MKSIGIFISSNNHFEKIYRLCDAAKKKDIEIYIFLSHAGVLLTQDERFARIAALATKTSLCLVGFESHDLKKPVPGLDEKSFGSQSRHAELIEKCERYLVF